MWWIGFLLLPSASLPAGGFIFHTPFSFSMPLPLTNEMRAKVMIVTSTKVLKISVQSTVYIFSFWHDQIELPLQSGSQDKNNLEQSCSQPANDMYHEQEIDLCYAIHWDLGAFVSTIWYHLHWLMQRTSYVSLGHRFNTEVCDDSLKVFKLRNKMDRWLDETNDNGALYWERALLFLGSPKQVYLLDIRCHFSYWHVSKHSHLQTQ